MLPSLSPASHVLSRHMMRHTTRKPDSSTHPLSSSGRLRTPSRVPQTSRPPPLPLPLHVDLQGQAGHEHLRPQPKLALDGARGGQLVLAVAGAGADRGSGLVFSVAV